MNIVVSRRKLLEERRDELKSNLMTEIELDQVRKGIVKNITDFGAFVDLGGIDGLLHITDMSWGRINHPNEILTVEQEIDVKVLKIDKDRERISLGLKQTQPSPWDDIESRFPSAAKVTGQVVTVLAYGAVIRLEAGYGGPGAGSGVRRGLAAARVGGGRGCVPAAPAARMARAIEQPQERAAGGPPGCWTAQRRILALPGVARYPIACSESGRCAWPHFSCSCY